MKMIFCTFLKNIQVWIFFNNWFLIISAHLNVSDWTLRYLHRFKNRFTGNGSDKPEYVFLNLKINLNRWKQILWKVNEKLSKIYLSIWQYSTILKVFTLLIFIPCSCGNWDKTNHRFTLSTHGIYVCNEYFCFKLMLLHNL